jgi:signal transduction histidine kinase
MKRLKLLILVFLIALSIPLAFFVFKTVQGLEQEEVATLQYFAEAILDEMEQSLATLVQREEGRTIDAYNYFLSPSGRMPEAIPGNRSPLSYLPQESYILGYFQNNPDGSFQTPLVQNEKELAKDRLGLVVDLKNANLAFNQKRAQDTDRVLPQPTVAPTQKQAVRPEGLADRYMDTSRSRAPKAFLGRKEKRVEEVTIGQALQVAKPEREKAATTPGSVEQKTDSKSSLAEVQEKLTAVLSGAGSSGGTHEYYQEELADLNRLEDVSGKKLDENFQVEVAPLQSIFINPEQIYVFRRIIINNQLYRQGFILLTDSFLKYLTDTFFRLHPMASYTNLSLAVRDQGRVIQQMETDAIKTDAKFELIRTFPSPFSFLSATLTCDQIPRSSGRRTLTIMLGILAGIILLGFFAIYQSTRTIVEVSERRSQFVSAVTHELKTPLTNIRMYIEMLEQGIAKDQEREQDYYRILDSEGLRLSRLINNVLDLSKLEKNQRHVDMQTGSLVEVIAEVQTVMREKLRMEAFVLNVAWGELKPFAYDREAMIQIFINLIENSLKFGKKAEQREITIKADQDTWRTYIQVSDRGPGIPRRALKKVFDDFYRADNTLTRETRGTGIGLALVRKLVSLMGGTVTAENNNGPGCTITISLPL